MHSKKILIALFALLSFLGVKGQSPNDFNDSLLLDSLVMDMDQWWKINLCQNIEKLAKGGERSCNSSICIYDITADSIMYSYNGQRLVTPASTMKLLTSITAITNLGKDFDIKTQVWCNGKIEVDSVRRRFFKGDIYVAGAFDPTLTYSDVRQIARKIKEMGVDSIDGKIYADAHKKDTLMSIHRWSWDNIPLSEEYFITPLTFNKGMSVREAWTGSPYAYKSGRVKHPEIYFVKAICKILQDEGVKFTSSEPYGKKETPKYNNHYLTAISNPLSKVLRPMMKQSDNFYAESVLLMLSQERNKQRWSYNDCKHQIANMMQKAGVRSADFTISDGSGLSHANKVTPEAEVKLLVWVYKHPNIYKVLREVLPIAGVDGTLSKRMGGTKAYNNVRAKTGTVSGISTLAGYVTASNGHVLVFSIMNSKVSSTSYARSLQDKMCVEMAK